jgi:hypothetical protein
MDYIAHAEEHQLIGIAEKLVNYIEKENIKTIIVPGTSAQNAAFVLREVFKKQNKTAPRFIALGAFKKNYGDRQSEGFVSTKRHLDLANEVIESRLSNLLKNGKIDPKKGTLILEEFVENGISISVVESKLKKMGFLKIKKGSFISMGTEKLDFMGAKGGEPRFFGFRRRVTLSLLKMKRFFVKDRLSKYEKITNPRTNLKRERTNVRKKLRNSKKP